MLNNKFIVLFALGVSLQSRAMELQLQSQQPAASKTITLAVVQVYPGCIRTTKVFEKSAPQVIEDHEKVVSMIASLCSAEYVTSKQDVGYWSMSFRKPIEFNYLQQLCKLLPGFEELHDGAIFFDKEKTIQEELLALRELQLPHTKQLPPTDMQKVVQHMIRISEKVYSSTTLEAFKKVYGSCSKALAYKLAKIDRVAKYSISMEQLRGYKPDAAESEVISVQEVADVTHADVDDWITSTEIKVFAN